jgi:hypothetical protein
MEYGKPLGIASGGGVALLGIKIGYGWFVLGSLTFTVATILLIRLFFRRGR